MKTNIQLYKDICLRFAEESKCLSKKVGCIIVKDNRIISSGINGTTPGHVNCNDYWKQYHKDNNINLPFDDWLKTSEWRELHHKWSEEHEHHGETNALMFAAKKGIYLRGSSVFISLEPCIHCMKSLLLIEPEVVYYINEYDKNNVRAKDYFAERNIKCEQI